MPVFNIDAFREIYKAAGDNSTRQVAARTGLDRGLIARLLNGSRQPTLPTFVRIADTYEADMHSLILRDRAA